MNEQTISHELVNSGLASMLKMNTTGSGSLSEWVGRTVQYKQELQEDLKFLKAHGTMIIGRDWKVIATQKDYSGKEVLRIAYVPCSEYPNGDDFGRCAEPENLVY